MYYNIHPRMKGGKNMGTLFIASGVCVGVISVAAMLMIVLMITKEMASSCDLVLKESTEYESAHNELFAVTYQPQQQAKQKRFYHSSTIENESIVQAPIKVIPTGFTPDDDDVIKDEEILTEMDKVLEDSPSLLETEEDVQEELTEEMLKILQESSSLVDC